LDLWDNPEFRHIRQQFKGVIVSHSGGLDSTALLHLFWRFSQGGKIFGLGVFHVNFGLRGEASDGDEAFSRQLAQSLNLPFFSRRISETERAERSGEGIQAWARRLRRAESARLAADGWAIALAHHLDDQAETVLMRLARGARPSRLLGMRAWASPYWRPLLGVRRAELAAYIARHGYTRQIRYAARRCSYTRRAGKQPQVPARHWP